VLAVAHGHWIADVFGVVQSGHISPDWGSVETRLAQWRPTSGQGVQGAVSDVMRWAAWLTDSGVGAFLILTGLVLTLGVRTEPAAFSSPRATISWYLRRMAATLPAWVFLHFVMLALVSAREGPALIFDYHFWASLVGIRFTPGMFYFLVPAWWYMALLWQCYLVFPLLYLAAQRFGAGRMAPVGIGFGLSAKAAGLLLLSPSWLETWNRGGIVVTRLPELCLGILVATYASRRPAAVDSTLTSAVSSPLATVAALTLVGLAPVLGVTLLGNVFSQLFGAIGWSMVALWFGRLKSLPIEWLGAIFFDFYLFHQIPIELLTTRQETITWEALAMGLASFALGVGGAYATNRITAPARGALLRHSQRLKASGAETATG